MSDRRDDSEKRNFCLQAVRASLASCGPRGQSWASGGGGGKAENGAMDIAGMGAVSGEGVWSICLVGGVGMT